MTPEERQQFEQMQETINEMASFIGGVFNPDGSMKNPPLVIEADDAVTTPAGSVRIQTNLGPKNFLIT